MKILLHPTYFPNIASCAFMQQADAVVFEYEDNYQKQTYRNRTHILGANGKLALSIPVIYTQKNRQLYKEIKISNTENWQAHHWKSLISAYSTSPFFEFYRDEFEMLFNASEHFLMDFNFKCLDVLNECLQWDLSFTQTENYDKEPKDSLDLRHLVNARKETAISLETYTQVFSDKHGFSNNLSILDLLFNEGPNAANYLSSQSSVKDLVSL